MAVDDFGRNWTNEGRAPGKAWPWLRVFLLVAASIELSWITLWRDKQA